MRIYVVARPRPHSSPLPRAAVRFLSDALRSADCAVLEDVLIASTDDVTREVDTCAADLHRKWQRSVPDVVHAVGLVAVLAAARARPRGVPIVATFDEWPSDREQEATAAALVDAVLPLSRAECERWHAAGVRTLSFGVAALPIPTPSTDASAAANGSIIMLSDGPVLEAMVEALPHLGGAPLVLMARLDPERKEQLWDRARALRVADRLQHMPGVRGRTREEVWAGASVLVAGFGGSRHGCHVLEAAAHGVPSVATGEGAHLDHVINGVTGMLVDPRCGPVTLAQALAPLLGDSPRARGMGSAALVRVQSLHDPGLAGGRFRALFDQVVDCSRDDAVTAAGSDGLTGDGLTEDQAQLAVDHMPLAVQLAHWYCGRGQSMDDLVQVASLGLVRAAGRFDPDHGKPFHSFAIPTILGELRRYFRDHAWAVRVPRGLQETTLRVQRASEDLRMSLGHEASAAEVADQLGLLTEEVLEAQQAQGEARSSNSLDMPVGEGGTEVFGDIIGGPDPALDAVESVNDVRSVLQRIPARELEIVLLRFYGERTQAEIADRLGISQVHVSRVLSRTLATVRDHVLYDEPLPDTWERAATP